MFYKLDTKTGEWHCGNEVHFPDGEKLNKNNKVKKDEWEWLDNPPVGYAEQAGMSARHINKVSPQTLESPTVKKASLLRRIITFIYRLFV